MFELTATMDPAAEPPYIYWWSDAEAHATGGSSTLTLGKPRQAEAHFRDALACIAPSFPRDRLHILTRLALARVQLRELDGACRAATEAGTLLRRLDSPNKRTLLAEFHTAGSCLGVVYLGGVVSARLPIRVVVRAGRGRDIR